MTMQATPSWQPLQHAAVWQVTWQTDRWLRNGMGASWLLAFSCLVGSVCLQKRNARQLFVTGTVFVQRWWLGEVEIAHKAQHRWTSQIFLLSLLVWSSGMAVSKPACCGLGSKVDTATLYRRQLAEPKLATVLLNDLAKKGQLEAARQVLAFLQKQGVANVIHVNTLISATGRNEDWERCLSLLAELRPKSIHPTVVSFNAVLKVLGILRWRFAAGLLQEMQFVRSQDIISFNTVLSVMSTNRARWRDVHALMHSMLPATFAPDAFSVTCVTSCLQVQNWKVAASIFNEYNGPIDTAAVNALIGLSHSCWRSSLHVLFNMRANRIDTTRRSWNSYNFQRHWRLGIAAIQEPKPDVISFNSAASACEKQGLWGFGLELFSIVRTMSLKADIVSYNVAMLASAELHWSGMVTMLDEMLRVRIHPDGASYVAALLRKNEGPSLADTLLKHMSRAQVEKDATIVGALIGYACQSEGRWQTALSWLLSLTPKIDQVSCGTAISTFEKAQRWKESLELFILQKAKRIQLDVISTGAALSALASETCRWRLSLHFLSQTLQTQPNRASYTATMGACITQNWERTLNVLNHMTDLSLEADIATNHLAARAWADRKSMPFVAVMTTMSHQLCSLLSVRKIRLNSCDFHTWEIGELSLS